MALHDRILGLEQLNQGLLGVDLLELHQHILVVLSDDLQANQRLDDEVVLIGDLQESGQFYRALEFPK